MARFGVIPLEPPRDRSRANLAPGFDRKLGALLDYLTERGHSPIVAETLRNDARVAFLRGFGRAYDDGRGVVTNADDAATTWHGFGLAADIWDGARKNDPWAISGTPFADALRDGCEAVGLTWGGSWKMADLPHVQWAPMKDRPSEVGIALYRQGAIAEVWKLVGADT